MRVAYELTVLEVDSSGVARYVSTLREALTRRADLELIDIAQPSGRAFGRALRGLERELVWFPRGVGRAAVRSGADLLHCPGHLGPPVAPGLPLVVTIFDVMALEHPEWFTRANAAHVRLVWPRMLRRAAAVIVAAEFTRERLLERFGGLDPARVHVVQCGVDRQFAPGGDRPPGDRYVLTVGRLQPRKNLEAALDAFEAIAGDHPDVRLIVAGARGWRDESLLARLRASPVADRVTLAGRVSDEELVRLYQGAACFLFPSLYEGFGFPPLEAMACGAPVVCSDATTLPEVVGDAGLLVDARDPAAVAGALGRVLSDAELAASLRERGLARARGFTWDACAAGTAAAYAAALAG